jgi:hypothetical protein
MLTVCLAMGGLFVCDGAEARIVVTVADHMNHKPQALKREDISGVGSMRIENVSPLRGEGELYILIDEAADYDFGAKLDDIRHFVESQPASTAVGVAYIKDGELKIAQPPTRVRETASRALHAPGGSRAASPYCALSSLVAGWPGDARQRAVVMITSGMDSTAVGAICVNAEMAIADAQRAGVAVYAIYHPAANYDQQAWRAVDSGVVDLSHVCYETGGEAYFIGHGPMETIASFLDDVAEHLTNQYVVTVSFDYAREAGFQQVYLNGAVPGMELMAPAKVWVNVRPKR